MEVKGKIEFIEETKRVSDKLSKKMFVVTTADKYPQSIPMELMNDKCSLVDNLGIGSEVTAHVNLRGRKWVNPQGEVKYFGSVECWKLEVSSKVEHTEATVNIDNGSSDLPF